MPTNGKRRHDDDKENHPPVYVTKDDVDDLLGTFRNELGATIQTQISQCGENILAKSGEQVHNLVKALDSNYQKRMGSMESTISKHDTAISEMRAKLGDLERRAGKCEAEVVAASAPSRPSPRAPERGKTL